MISTPSSTPWPLRWASTSRDSTIRVAEAFKRDKLTKTVAREMAPRMRPLATRYAQRSTSSNSTGVERWAGLYLMSHPISTPRPFDCCGLWVLLIIPYCRRDRVVTAPEISGAALSSLSQLPSCPSPLILRISFRTSASQEHTHTSYRLLNRRRAQVG